MIGNEGDVGLPTMLQVSSRTLLAIAGAAGNASVCAVSLPYYLKLMKSAFTLDINVNSPEHLSQAKRITQSIFETVFVMAELKSDIMPDLSVQDSPKADEAEPMARRLESHDVNGPPATRKELYSYYAYYAGNNGIGSFQ